MRSVVFPVAIRLLTVQLPFGLLGGVPCSVYDQSDPVNLPNVLECLDGRVVSCVREWECVRRPEILSLFTHEVYGVRPVERPDDLRFEQVGLDECVLGGVGVHKSIRAIFSGKRSSWNFDFHVLIPSCASRERRVPAFVLICNRELLKYADPSLANRSEFFPAERIMRRGCAAVVFKNTQLGSDEDSYRPRYCEDGSIEHVDPAFTNGFYACWAERRTEDSWGAISSWAWGASRIMDWIASDTNTCIDLKHVAIVGHSRGGKAAFWAAATDARFALACVNDSGCCGAKLNHVAVPLSETIGQDNKNNPHWFCRAYRRFNGKDFVLPFDQHWLAALVAPRLLYIASASEDLGAGPWGEFLTARHASAAWELYGLRGLVENHPYAIGKPFHKGCIGYHLRSGGHDLTVYDWNHFLDFAGIHGWPVGVE